MRVAIIGAGITGAALAFELAADGHDVTVFERCGSAAAESSFATGGLLAAGLALPWRGSGMRLLRGVFTRGGPSPVLGFGAGGPRWLWRAWRASGARVQGLNRGRMLRLAQLSQSRIEDLSRSLPLEFERSRGVLTLLRSPKELARSQAELTWLNEHGVKATALDAEGCRAVEPGLSDATALHGGIHFPDDEVGNCRQVALLMRSEAERRGARFQFGAEVTRLTPGRPAELTWRPTPAPDETPGSVPAPRAERFDAIVCCTALGATPLLAPLGLRLPLLAVHGYSVTAPMRHHDDDSRRGPRSAVVDARHQIVLTRLGSRLRATGGFEIGGGAAGHREASLKLIYRVLNDWFPGVAQMGQAVRWKGARPMLPDGPPVLGASGLEGVWLNLGHGSHGWAMACGSARVLADALGGRAPAIDLEGLGIERLRL